MTPHLERWLTAPVSVRLLCWLAWTMAWLVVGWLALAPTRQENAAQALRYQKLMQTVERQRQQLAGHQDEAQHNRQITALEAKLKPEPFSALELVQAHGGRLARWSPDGQRGELVVDLAWPQVPAFFARLARYDIEATAFTLAPHEKSLRLSLQLEMKHAQ
ncbi:hypothetical protein MT962_003721 [Franconibacter sp. IITDAS19]|uniref:HofO family protein n=1 Tax=Franconibacter sp. IITDAS19 TaxID=2930569 RepID=UPI001FFA28CE|nr:hypothetical protein [Franconibacter sp. IITDAS19]MCK1969854.1 hypothetical protein [Franconibacter sp. IITDAS19]